VHVIASADGTRTNIIYAWCGDCTAAPGAIYRIITATTGAPQFIE